MKTFNLARGGELLLRVSLNTWRKLLNNVEKSSSTSSCIDSQRCSFLRCSFPFNKRQRTSNSRYKGERKECVVPKDVPKGHMVVYVGKNMRRFVVKIGLLKQHSFVALLEVARDEHNDSPTPLKLWIPCDEIVFLDVVREASASQTVVHPCPYSVAISKMLNLFNC